MTDHHPSCPADDTCAPRVVDGTLQPGCAVLTPETLVDAIDAWFGRRRGAAAMASDREHAEDLVRYLGELGYSLVVVTSCRACGCTDDEACFPSCWWTEPDLCSNCTPPPRTEDGPVLSVARYAVALYTMGSFHGWASDPLTEDEAQAFLDDPPEMHKPRPQDRLVVFELDDIGMVAHAQAPGVPS